MRVAIRCEPLSYYVAKLDAGEPFCSLLYGDGEFQVLMGQRTGQRMQNGELVTEKLEREMLASLDVADPAFLRGTDPNLLNYEAYEGRDFRALHELGTRINHVLAGRAPLEWYDGVVWDRAVRDGDLGPFLGALRGYPTVLVANPALSRFAHERLWGFLPIPERDAVAELDQLEGGILETLDGTRSPRAVVLLCMGIGAIPLAMRLRQKVPHVTILDLGSTFDIFAGLGKERGWRQALYEDKKALKETIRKNLEGS